MTNILPEFPGWNIIPVIDEATIKSVLGLDLNEIIGEEGGQSPDAATHIYYNKNKRWIIRHQSGKFSTIVYNDDRYGTFEECVELISQMNDEDADDNRSKMRAV